MLLSDLHQWVSRILDEVGAPRDSIVDELDSVRDGDYDSLERLAVRHEAYLTAALIVEARDGVQD